MVYNMQVKVVGLGKGSIFILAFQIRKILALVESANTTSQSIIISEKEENDE